MGLASRSVSDGPSPTSARRSCNRAGISVGGGDPERGLDRAMAGREGVEQRAGHVLGHGAGGDHPQQLGRALGPADRVLGLDGQVHHLRRDGDQALAAGRELHAGGRALDEGSPRCWRSAASAPDTAGSLTPSTRAAAFTDPSRATSTKASSWVSVMARTRTLWIRR